MKKRGRLLVIAVFVLLFSSVVASATDVAYIYRRQSKVDNNILDVFNSLGLNVEMVNERDLPASFDGYKLIFVGDEKFRKNIPVNEYPSIVANYYHADVWGLTDNEGVSQMGATQPLSVMINGYKRQVYTQAFYSSTVSIPYYFLDKGNKASSLLQVAATETASSGYKVGDVISYAEPGAILKNGKTQEEKLCFYGIIKSKYWTSYARSLFEDCVSFVAGQCVTDSDCPEDVVSGLFCGQDGNVYQTVTSYSCQNGGAGSACVPNEEDILVTHCESGCENGACISIACSTNEDCDDTNSNTIDTCHNPGTPESYCTNEAINCFSDFECNDNNPLTLDDCINDGTVASMCLNTPINCASDLDCGATGFVGGLACSWNDIIQNYQTAVCLNAGTTNSQCNLEVTSQVTGTCEFACTGNGVCIRCDENPDCSDGNDETADLCHNPGEIGAYCENPFAVPQDIACVSDEQCGTNNAISQLFCSLNDVNHLFKTWTCNNPNTIQSYCSSGIEQIVVETCLDFCFSGACQFFACHSDGDCYDINHLTLDYCSGIGTSGAHCENIPINCASDADCDDSDALTQDICVNPAQLNSYCSHNYIGECFFGETMLCGASGIGECELGVQSCGADGIWGACVGEVPPVTEICDGFDNDCDGVIDEDDVCPICADECVDGEQQCIHEDGYRVCHDYNGDGCTEWSGDLTCGYGKQCDGGFCI